MKFYILTVCLAMLAGCDTTKPAELSPEGNPYIQQGHIQIDRAE